MNDNRLIDYLGHMLQAARLAYSYVEGLGKDDFLADTRTQQAVILNIVVIGGLPPNSPRITLSLLTNILRYRGVA